MVQPTQQYEVPEILTWAYEEADLSLLNDDGTYWAGLLGILAIELWDNIRDPKKCMA